MKKVMVSLMVLGFCMVTSQIALAKSRTPAPRHRTGHPSHLGLMKAGFQVGLVSPEDVNSTVGFGANADLGTVAPNIHLEPRLDYWSKSEDVFGGGKTTISDMAVGMRGKYMFPVSSPKVQPFAGAGLGLHFVHAKVEIPDQNIGGTVIPGMTIEDSTTKLGLDLGGGMMMPMSPRTDLVTELWYGIVSDVSQLSVKVGMQFRVGS